jgi:hypothetical protein
MECPIHSGSASSILHIKYSSPPAPTSLPRATRNDKKHRQEENPPASVLIERTVSLTKAHIRALRTLALTIEDDDLQADLRYICGLVRLEALTSSLPSLPTSMFIITCSLIGIVRKTSQYHVNRLTLAPSSLHTHSITVVQVANVHDSLQLILLGATGLNTPLAADDLIQACCTYRRERAHVSSERVVLSYQWGLIIFIASR